MQVFVFVLTTIKIANSNSTEVYKWKMSQEIIFIALSGFVNKDDIETTVKNQLKT